MNKKMLIFSGIIIISILTIIIFLFLSPKKETLDKMNFKDETTNKSNSTLKSNNKSKIVIEKITNNSELNGTSLIRTFDDEMMSSNLSSDEMMLNIGKVFNCLGDPSYTSINSENWFEYDLKCDGIVLSVYGNSLDIHIGGMRDEKSKEKATELVEYIKTCKPKDIYYEAYYMDIPVKEIFEIKSGKSLYRYEELDLNDDEFKKLYDKVYNIK